MDTGDVVVLLLGIAGIVWLVTALAFSYREEDDDWFR